MYLLCLECINCWDQNNTYKNMNLFLTVDIISGVGCLIMAVLMHFSEIGCLREETNMRRGRTMVELLLLLVGVLTLVTGLGGEKYYEIL